MLTARFLMARAAPRVASAVAALCLGGLGVAQPYGLATPRPSNSALKISTLPPDAPGAMTATRVFPSLTFNSTTFITESPDATGRLFVLEKGGRLKTFLKGAGPVTSANPTAGSVVTWLDLSARVYTVSEQGLLGLAFDKDFATNGRFYVHYNVNSPRRSVISRFTASPPNAATVSLSSEQVLLEVSQPFDNHKGGWIGFGPDDKLYISLGDGGSADDPGNRGQDTTQLLGKLLRIDVTGTTSPGLAYGIPSDNPFVSGGPGGASTRKEIWAYGLRNPWRCSFDRLNGTFFCSDVGQNTWEEVDVIVKGGNYGWRRREGAHCFNPSTGCEQAGQIDPIAEYSHSEGFSITGGYVYYGTAVPSLYGKYIYGDYVTKKVWSLTYNGVTATSPVVLTSDAGFNISAFGQDQSGEVFLCAYSATGGIYVLRPSVAPVGTPFPTRLSDIPALWNAGRGIDQTTVGIVPYRPSAQLWSDGATKERFVALPDTDDTGLRTDDRGWDFGENSLIVKNFVVPADDRFPAGPSTRVETRLMMKKNNVWNGFSYRWNDAGTDADLLTSGSSRALSRIDKAGNAYAYTWQFPSRAQCAACHTDAANGTLGLTTAQMNSDFGYPSTAVTDNQIRAWDHAGYFSAALPGAPATLPKMPDYRDATATTASRAKAYLASNCSMCHQPGGTAPTAIDLRWSTLASAMNVIDVAPGAGDLGVAGARIVAPGDPSRSVLLKRMAERGVAHQMPPLASSRADDDGVAVVRSWILGLSPATGVKQWTIYE